MQEKFHFQAKGMPLIKFQDADKIKSLQSGKIYAKTLGYYRKREEKFRFTDKQKEKMLSFGDTALIVLDHDEFIRRVKVAAEQAGYKVYFKPVQYYDPTIDGGNMLISLLAGMWNIAFWKRDSYTYQQEVRFVFTPGDENIDHIELDIGDISDITAIISAKSALSAIVEKAVSSETESDFK